jgi:hypothetical protein
MESVLSQRGRKENQSSHSSLRGVRYSAHRVLKPIAGPNAPAFNDRQIAQQLMEEFARIADLLDQCALRRRGCDLPLRQIDPVRSIINLEEVIASQDEQIAVINEEIKDLKSASRIPNDPK